MFYPVVFIFGGNKYEGIISACHSLWYQ